MKHTNIHSLDNRKGDLAEFYAVTWLWDKGYEVFKNCGCSGPIDLIATKDGKMTYIDVKTCLLYTSPSPRDRQKSRMPSSA